MNDRLISLNAAIDALRDRYYKYDRFAKIEELVWAIEALPSAESELENKIRAIGYTGKEGRIYIGGRLFAVRELAQ